MTTPQLGLDFRDDARVPVHPALAPFHPVVRAWFQETLGEPTEPQIRGWPLIREKRDVLIAAPTGSGKTLTAFLACLDQLFRAAALGTLTDATQVLYVSPLKALGNDVQKNLLEPLEQLKKRARQAGVELPSIRVQVRTGDTNPAERAAMVKTPPHILITTPESLYLYLTADRSRKTLGSVHTVVVDEIHALARDKRGSHFALSMERLKALLPSPPQLIGLSATTKPLERLAHFLSGAPRADRPPVEIVQVGHVRPWQLSVETPEDELTAVATHEMWGQVYDRLVELSKEHRTLLVFTNTRKLAERVAHDLGERLGPGLVHAHHGSMSRELRLAAEDRLKAGALKVMVATASLELGIDIGSIDLVVQLGSPRAIAVMLQRLGRSGHRKSAVSKGILVALTRDELVEAAALVRAISEGQLDATLLPDKPLDVLAQQIVAEVAAQEWDEDALFSLFRRAMPYQALTREEYEQVLHLVSEGVATSRGRSRVHLHRDRVNGWLKPRKGARLMALQNGGAIPDTFQYPVVVEPEDKQVGSVDEDFAVESAPGDVFVLGSNTWRIRRIFDGQVRVEAANGLPPSVPFWLGEAPARTMELSREVARLREDVAKREDAREWLEQKLELQPSAADLLVRYVKAGAKALSAVPSQTTVVAERFFDEAGGMQLILHAPFGARINRAWGLTLRKSFCRAFDFELQAAASDDGILLSLGEQHSFPLMDIFDFVQPKSAERVLVQAVLQGPMFGTRFRWAAGRALALARLQNGKRVPPIFQRARAEDLIAAVFPEQVGCQDNHGGQEIEPPDHPLVNETMKDCLHELMDLDGLVEVLQAMKDGRIKKVAADVPEPSVFAHQMLTSAPYTYLDDAPLEERRARAVSVRRTLPAEDVKAFGALDQAAIDQVAAEALPAIRDAEELHDALLQLGVLPLDVLRAWHSVDALLPTGELAAGWVETLRRAGRAGVFAAPPFTLSPSTALRTGCVEGCRTSDSTSGSNRLFLYPAERVPVLRALYPQARLELAPLPGDGPVDEETAARQVVRGWMELLGPTTVTELSALVGLGKFPVESALARLEAQGQVLRGTFRPAAPVRPDTLDRNSDPVQPERSRGPEGPGIPIGSREVLDSARTDRFWVRTSGRPCEPVEGGQDATEWCDRRLLQRIHRLTVGRLRREIEPLSPRDFMRFLFRWHHLSGEKTLRGPQSLARVVSLLQGYEAPAAAWETELFPARMAKYQGDWLEQACWGGDVAWGRLTLREAKTPYGSRRGLAVPEPEVRRVPAPTRSANPESGQPELVEGRRIVGSRQALDSALAERNGVGSSDSLPAPEVRRVPAPTRSANPESGQPELVEGRRIVGSRQALDSALAERNGVGSSDSLPAPAARRVPAPTRSANLTFVRRGALDWLLEAARPDEGLSDGPRPFPEDLSAPAKDVALALERRGASFFAELTSSTRRLPAEVEDALWELLARGLVTADAVQNLRVLLSPKLRRRQRALQRGGPGRWSLLRHAETQEPEEREEKLAQLFLERYGIVFRDLLGREPLAPPWRELVRVYRRLEARGEIRGGRFLAGFAGEQFGLNDAVELARQVRRTEPAGERVRVAAVDPLNLTGIVTPGPRVPAQLGQSVVYVDGVPEPKAVEVPAEVDAPRDG